MQCGIRRPFLDWLGDLRLRSLLFCWSCLGLFFHLFLNGLGGFLNLCLSRLRRRDNLLYSFRDCGGWLWRHWCLLDGLRSHDYCLGRAQLVLFDFLCELSVLGLELLDHAFE